MSINPQQVDQMRQEAAMFGMTLEEYQQFMANQLNMQNAQQQQQDRWIQGGPGGGGMNYWDYMRWLNQMRGMNPYGNHIADWMWQGFNKMGGLADWVMARMRQNYDDNWNRMRYNDEFNRQSAWMDRWFDIYDNRRKDWKEVMGQMMGPDGMFGQMADVFGGAMGGLGQALGGLIPKVQNVDGTQSTQDISDVAALQTGVGNFRPIRDPHINRVLANRVNQAGAGGDIGNALVQRGRSQWTPQGTKLGNELLQRHTAGQANALNTQRDTLLKSYGDRFNNVVKDADINRRIKNAEDRLRNNAVGIYSSIGSQLMDNLGGLFPEMPSMPNI